MTTIIRTPCDEGIIRGAPASAPVATPRWSLVVAILGSSMAFVDGTVSTVALPAIGRDLAASVAGMQWVVESYALMLSALVLVGGSLGDQFGRRRIFATGVAIFAVASAGCGVAGTITQLIVMRALQGIGAALLVPGSLALISAAYPEETRGRAIGTWSGFSGITAALGPIVGGWLVEHRTWRWAFFINVPVAAAVLVLLWTRVVESRGAHRSHDIDWGGALLASAGLGAVVYGLIEIPARGWTNPVILAALAGGALLLGMFVRHEASRHSPMLPLDLFRSRTFSGANVLTLLLYAALGAAMFFLPLNLIQVQRYSATGAGAALVPLIVIMFVMSRWAGGLVGRYGSKGPLVVGPIIAAAGFASLGVPGVGGSYWSTFLPGVVVLGIGMVITVAPLTTTVMAAVQAGHAGLASGVNNAVARTASLMAIAVLGIVVGNVFGDQLRIRLAERPLSPAVRSATFEQRTKWAGARVPSNISAELQAAIRDDIDRSFVAAFRVVMVVCTALAIAGSVSALLLVSSRPEPRSGLST